MLKKRKGGWCEPVFSFLFERYPFSSLQNKAFPALRDLRGGFFRNLGGTARPSSHFWGGGYIFFEENEKWNGPDLTR